MALHFMDVVVLSSAYNEADCSVSFIIERGVPATATSPEVLGSLQIDSTKIAGRETQLGSLELEYIEDVLWDRLFRGEYDSCLS